MKYQRFTKRRNLCGPLVVMMVLTAGLMGWTSCQRQEGGQMSEQQPVVYASVPPLAYLAERIAGQQLAVETLVEAGQNPHMYEPTPKEMVKLGQAQVFFRIGMPFEERILEKLQGQNNLQIRDTREGIEPALLQEHEHHHHDHDSGETGDAHDHDHDHHQHGEQIDPHVWMSPQAAQVLARNMADVIIEIDPAHKEEYERNLHNLLTELQALDKQVAEVLTPLRGRTLYVFHPAFGYLAREYGLVQKAVETGGKTPGPKQVKELIEQMRADKVKVLFVQPQFSDQSARTIAEQIDGAVVAIDPLAKNYIENLREMAQTIRRGLRDDDESKQ